MSACGVCSSLDEASRLRLQSMYETGRSYKEIASEFRLPLSDVEHHCMACTQPQVVAVTPSAERISNLIEQLTSDLELARQQYKDNVDDRDSAASYTTMAKELRQAIELSQNMVRPEDQARTILQDVLNPAIQAITMSAISEIKLLRDELVTSGMDAAIVQAACNARATALSVAIKQTLVESTRKVNKIHGLTQASQIASAKQTAKK